MAYATPSGYLTVQVQVPVTDSLVPASLMDRQLAEQAANAGRMLEAAYSVADRELALIWQRTMFDIVKLRRARRFGLGTENEGECFGG